MLLSLYLYRDVFAVLAERCAAHVGSGRDKDMGCYRGLMPQSITKTFKAAVRDKIRRGEGVSLDMVVPTFPRNDVSSYAATVQSATSSGRSTIGQPKTRPRTSSSASDTEIPSSRGTEKKAVAISSAEYGKADTGPRKIIGATATAGGPRVERIMTHWSPLRDVHGKVGWCVLVLAGSS